MLKLISDDEILRDCYVTDSEMVTGRNCAQAQLEAVKKELLSRIVPKPYLDEDDEFYYPIRLTEQEYQQLKGGKDD